MASGLKLFLAAAPVVVAGVCWLIDSQFQNVDREIFSRLVFAFGTPPDSVVGKIWQGQLPQAYGLELLLCLVISIAAIIAAYKLAVVARTIVVTQLLALTLLFEWG